MKTSAMSVNDLAKESKVEYTTINRILTGETPQPRRNTLAPLAKALNTSVDYLMTGIEKESETTLLKRAMDKLEEQLDRKDKLIERLMGKLLDHPNFRRALNGTGLTKRSLGAAA